MSGSGRKKTKKNKKGGRRKRTLKGGMGYGFGGALGTNGPVWDSSWGGEVTKSGQPVYDTANPQRGSSRRRKGGKRGRNTKKGGRMGFCPPDMSAPDPQTGKCPDGRDPLTEGGRRKRSMKGGAAWQSPASVGYAFTGTGARGISDAVGYASKVPVAGGPSQNPDGAYRA